MENKQTKIEQLEEQIKILEKEKELELLRIEVEKLKKTKIEEEIIIHRKLDRWYSPYYTPGTTWINCDDNIRLCSC